MKKFLKKVIPDFVFDFAQRYHFVKGTKSFSQSPIWSVLELVRWMLYVWSDAEISFATPDGTKFVSMSHNFSSFVVYFDDYRDPNIHAFLKQHLRKDSVFVDAGANIGTYAVRAGQLIGTEGKVIAIEAFPLTYEYLKRNIALNNLKNVTPLNTALGAEHGTLAMAYNPANAGQTHVAVKDEKKINVSLRTLDEIMREISISNVDYLKINVEGFEFPLLMGAEKTITTSRHIVVQTELDEGNSERYGLPITKMIDLLFGWGLIPHAIDNAGKPIAKAKSELKMPCDVLWWRE